MAQFIRQRITRLEAEVQELLEGGLVEQAAEAQSEICRLASEFLSADVLTLCGHLAKLAETFRAAGRVEQSRAQYLSVRDRLEAHLRQHHLELLDESTTRTDPAIAIRHQTLEYGLETAQAINRLAMLHHRTGGHSRARQLLERALAITRHRLGVEHPEFAILLGNLASIEQAAGRFEEAERLYRQTLQILGSTLGKHHPELAQSQSDLAQLYSDQGRLQEALEWVERALETLYQRWGDEHPKLVQGLVEAATLQVEFGDLTAAEWHLLRALKILRASGYRTEPRQIAILRQLAETYRRMGDLVQAEAHDREASKLERCLGSRTHSNPPSATARRTR